MEKLKFSTNINAPKERVWEVLWNDAYYRMWTSVFSEGSYAETDWNEDSKILFLDGKGSGMVSFIAAKRPYEFMSFKHMGIVKDGVEQMDGEEVKAWQGSLENYTLTETNGNTQLNVEMDSNKDYKDYFEKTWPKALEQVKILAENNKE